MWYNPVMIKVLEDAIEKVKKLPQERQAFAAELLEQFVADADAGVFEIPDDHMAGVHEGLEQARRGEFVGDDEMASSLEKAGRMRVRYAPRARNDIVHIHQYVAAHNPKAAIAVVRRIRATARPAGTLPRPRKTNPDR